MWSHVQWEKDITTTHETPARDGIYQVETSQFYGLSAKQITWKKQFQLRGQARSQIKVMIVGFKEE